MIDFETLSIADLKAIHDLAQEMWSRKSIAQEEREWWSSLGAGAMKELKTRLFYPKTQKGGDSC
jgi:hypothetical protein